jgi:hypothetical protein
MKKLLPLGIVGLMFSMNVFADCGLHISNIGQLVKGKRIQTLEIKKAAEKKNYNLKFSEASLENGDLVVDGFILITSAEEAYVPYDDLFSSTLMMNYAGQIYSRRERVGVDYSKKLLLSEYQDGNLTDIDLVDLKYKMKFSKMKRKFGDTFRDEAVHTAVDTEVLKALISELPKCKK